MLDPLPATTRKAAAANDIINFAEWAEANSPHNSGKARCIACQHEWVAVAPTGVVWLQCPNCLTQKGLYVGPCERPGKHWKCECGNQLFYVTPEGVYCPNCGDWQRGF